LDCKQSGRTCRVRRQQSDGKAALVQQGLSEGVFADIIAAIAEFEQERAARARSEGFCS
jgi:hypothetical protein